MAATGAKCALFIFVIIGYARMKVWGRREVDRKAATAPFTMPQQRL